MKIINFLALRYSDNGKSTQGILLEKNDPKPIFFSHTLEDEFRKPDEKVKGETRIPAGIYELKILKLETPITLKHRLDYNKNGEDWFKFHIEITNIPNFSGVYIHAGNSEKHTEGCLLLNDTANNNMIEIGDMSRSVQAVKRFYLKIYPELEAGNKVFIDFRDENNLETLLK